jgi:AAA family ATP:ADP antiporter
MSRSFSTRWFKVQPDEGGSLGWSCVYFFCVLGGWYLLRPMRDAMGAAGGIDNLKYLYLATLGAMLVATVAFSAITIRYPRRTFIPVAYRFFILNLAVFFVLLKVLPASVQVNVGRVFYVWANVYNLFVMSVFWSFMADVFTNPQGKRLFPVIAVGGTFGHICGAFAAEQLAEPIGAEYLLLVTAVLLEIACQCVYRLARSSREPAADPAARRPASETSTPLGGGPLAGAGHVLRSPYLAGICLFMFCYTLTSTFLEITKLDIGSQQAAGQDARVAFFANIDFWTGIVTILAQVFLTGRMMARYGVGITLGVLPIVTLLGFAALGAAFLQAGAGYVVPVLILFVALRRASNYAVSKPAREVLYTVVGREDRFKAKNFIDTFVYRLGDQLGAWIYPALKALGATAVSFTALPLAAGWFVVALLLGARQQVLAEAA